MAELVARVRLRDRPRVRAGLLAGEEGDAVVGGEPLGVEAELRREAGIEQDELRAVRGLGLPGQGELGEGVGEMRAQGGNGRGHGATLRGEDGCSRTGSHRARPFEAEIDPMGVDQSPMTWISRLETGGRGGLR